LVWLGTKKVSKEGFLIIQKDRKETKSLQREQIPV